MEKMNRESLEGYKMRIPTYLEKYVREFQENDFVQLTLCSTAGNELFEVWYYGDFFKVKGEQQPYIVETDVAPEMIVAKDIITGEEILIHDGAKHGYDSLFCDEYEADIVQDRPLKQYMIPASKLVVTLGYSIDYESEKEEYNIDKNENVTLIDGRKMSWDDVKRNGMDYIGISYVNKEGDLVDFYDKELA